MTATRFHFIDYDPIRYKDRNKFTKDEISRLWQLKEDSYYQIVLMLIYSGCRISEFLDLKKGNVHLEESYFDVLASKTENDIRKVLIADKVLPFYRATNQNGILCRTTNGIKRLQKSFKI